MVRLGIIGLGEAWAGRYRDALNRLQGRACVQAVFDPVVEKSRQVADECHVFAADGIVELGRRPDVDAVLLLDSAWYGYEAVRLLCAEGKPIYLAADIGRDAATLQALHWTAVSYGLTLMPEFPLRYTPASSRLRELTATRLGRPNLVTVGVPPTETIDEAASQELMNWFDWIRYVAQSEPAGVAVQTSEAGEWTIRVEFADSTGNDFAPVGELHCTADRLPQQIVCEHGEAVIDSPESIRWQTGSEAKAETLTADRSELDVMLDHFCRRAVGGLIPVADLSDVSRGLELLAAAQESQNTGRLVELSRSA